MKTVGLSVLAFLLLAGFTGTASAHKPARKAYSYDSSVDSRYDRRHGRRARKYDRAYDHGQLARQCCDAAYVYAPRGRRHAARYAAPVAYDAAPVAYYVAYVPVHPYPQYRHSARAIEYDSSRLPIATNLWWDQLAREGRTPGGN
jgi:hypothetical protein